MSEFDVVLLIAVPALVLAGVAWFGAAGVNKRLGVLQTHNAALAAELELIRQSISGLTAGAVGMDRRVHTIEEREKALSERQEDFEIQQADEQPYGQAIRLVQQGAGVGRLINDLDISESEAELIVRLHGQRDSA